MHWSELDYQLYLRRQHQPVQGVCEAHKEDGIPEKKLLEAIRVLAKQYGYLLYHTNDSRRSEAGFPDVVLTNGTRTIFAELKRATEKLSADQIRWQSLLTHAGQLCYVWRPADLPLIEQLLSTKGGRERGV